MVVGPQILEEASEKVNAIKQRIKVVQDKQKSYVDIRRKEPKFLVGDKIYLKVSPTQGLVRFGSTGKLKVRYI